MKIGIKMGENANSLSVPIVIIHTTIADVAVMSIKLSVLSTVLYFVIQIWRETSI